MVERKSKDWEPSWQAEKGCWQVDFYIDGHRIRRRLSVRDESERGRARTEAKQIWRDAWDAARAAPTPVDAPKFFAAAAAYVESGGEARFLPRIIEYFGPETSIDDIDENTINDAGLALYPNAQTDTRRRQVRVPIRAVLAFASGDRPQPRQDNKRIDWLTPEEAERLLDAAATLTLPRHAEPEKETLAKIAFLLGTGTRTGECFAVDVADWNRATGQVWISGEETGAGKTALSARWVRMPSKTLSLIGDRPIGGRMFRTPYGKEIVLRRNGGGQMAEAFKKAVKGAQLGRHVTPHVLRHTWATWLYAQTRDYGALLDLGGWAKADTAERYRKLAPDDLADRLWAHGWDFTTPDQTGARVKGKNWSIPGKAQ